MHHYASEVNTNRPEAYLQDEEVLKRLTNGDERKTLAAHITSAAESGWDFSYRWTGTNYTNNEDEVLPMMITRNIVPVDLNILVAEERFAIVLVENCKLKQIANHFKAGSIIGRISRAQGRP